MKASGLPEMLSEMAHDKNSGIPGPSGTTYNAPKSVSSNGLAEEKTREPANTY